ncbi:hypothetical protein PF005_g4582 [Phytophthora fragariae]|uniref:EF-hand domain-containing protein n=1 Tax=Phytophthora fragariae TaxID=53985 RepID=A0A6A4EJM4_9STRA|nr:hypothetical protein PF009_g5147 [Phytophthora fragariae]KAE9023595.1 hypothetical protein PF011_g3910 [Phytophthora fragariae]KAE9126601.1 hypothetical protein PF007_g5920 [Phytophthora fragariae]KAE9127100.1 hypothetical protein PF010_g5047 [Phytophthora fragariae]KAE9151631.1 hypothetical protein PF006_g4078 [Phytophthora fragariae]
MFGRRKAPEGGEEAATKPLTVQERLELLEGGEALLKYPVGLLQPFTRQEIGRLKRRFVQLIPADDASRNLRLPLKVVLQMPELRAQPFVPLVARLVVHREGVDVESAKQTLELKRQVLFDVYDHDKKGCATVDDFVRVISTVSRLNVARRIAIRQGLEIQLAPFIKQAKSGASGVLLSDFSQIIVDDEVHIALIIAY